MHTSTTEFHTGMLRSWIACLAVAVSAFSFSAQAAEEDEDPPSRVARLSYLKGDVSLRPAGSDDETKDWTEPSLNRPLTSGDTIWVDRGGRAELQLGSANIHLDENTSFEFLELGDSMLQGSLTDGVLHLQVRRLEEGEIVEVDTPQAAIIVKRAGEYRIAVANDGASTEIKNYNGELEIIDATGEHQLPARQQARFGEEGMRSAAREALQPRDEFDSWAQERNRRTERSVASRYVSPDVIGYEDLDDHGDWTHDVAYGHVWYPRHVAVDWSPYRHGHWTWISPWGWTWVDHAPWGFAPFHYGRWTHLRGRWCWVPGPVRVRAVYAPALVAWVGAAPGINVSISIGRGIGWFPLGPREVYVPGYRSSRRYWHHVNHSNTVIVNNVYINRAYTNRNAHVNYANRGIRNAITVTNRDAFVGARPVHNHMVRVNDRELRNWRSVSSAPAIAPERVSRLSPRGEVSAPRQLRRDAQRDTLARRVNNADAPRRASFVQEQRAIRDNDNRPVSVRQLRPRETDAMAPDRQRRFDRPATPRGGEPAAATRETAPAAAPGNQRGDRPAMPSQTERADRPERSDRPDRNRGGDRNEPARTESPRNDAPRSRQFERPPAQAPRESRPAPENRAPESRGNDRREWQRQRAERPSNPAPNAAPSHPPPRMQERRPSAARMQRADEPQRIESRRQEAPRAAPEFRGERRAESRGQGRSEGRGGRNDRR